jgi:Na+/glutamate symporter
MKQSHPLDWIGAMKTMLPFWQRILLTVGVMLIASFIAGIISENLFGLALPSYGGGLVGGVAAIPVWDLLKRIRPSEK